MGASRDGKAVAVIGGGVIGYTCALELARDGHAVTVLTADPPENTVSAVAAAIWFPFHTGLSDAVMRWASTSFEVFSGLSGDPAIGVSMRPGLVLHRHSDPDLGWTSAVPDHGPAEPEALPPGVTSAIRCTVPVIEMSRYLPWLVEQASAAGVRTQNTPVRHLDQVDDPCDVVVVAAGLRSGELTGDTSMVPVRGQVVRLANPGLTQWLIDDDNPAGLTYIVPRGRDVVCGGTADEGAADTRVDPQTERAILQRTTALVPALRDAPILTRAVGLRPVRESVRLDQRTDAGRSIISCYGHGGAGVTLSWGCAYDVVELVGNTR
jgi:D-amino-acid oxidase